jgi:hypothetical protein
MDGMERWVRRAWSPPNFPWCLPTPQLHVVKGCAHRERCTEAGSIPPRSNLVIVVTTPRNEQVW